MYWAAQACLDLYLATDDVDMLDLGRRCLDRLSMFQQAFDHPELSLDVFGGFGVMNADGEFNDARQGLFAPLYMDYYLATGEPELFKRGVAALRSCFTTMLTEHHYGIAPGNMKHFRPQDRGAILENYAHVGRDQVTSGYLSPDWGCGTALYASGLAFRKFGQVFVDAPNKKAFGIDRCNARYRSLRRGVLSIEVSGSDLGEIEIVVRDPGKRVVKLSVNGKQAKPMSDIPGRFSIVL